MKTTVEALPHDVAILAALEEIEKPDHTKPYKAGFVKAPPGALEGVRARTGPDYMILYPLNSTREGFGGTAGSLGDPWSDAELAYQVHCIGRLPEGARWLADQIPKVLDGITVAGRRIVGVIPDDDGQVREDADISPSVFLATPRFTLQSVPATTPP